MRNTIETTDQSEKLTPSGRSPSSLGLVMLANAALVVGLLQMLPWVQCAVLVIAGAALAGGVVFMTPVLRDN